MENDLELKNKPGDALQTYKIPGRKPKKVKLARFQDSNNIATHRLLNDLMWKMVLCPSYKKNARFNGLVFNAESTNVYAESNHGVTPQVKKRQRPQRVQLSCWRSSLGARATSICYFSFFIREVLGVLIGSNPTRSWRRKNLLLRSNRSKRWLIP